MRVLVTGADGFVGPHVLKLIVDRGHEPIAALRGEEKERGTLSTMGMDLPAVPLELLDAASVRRAVLSTSPDAIVHLAGFSSVGRSWSKPAEAMQINGLGALHLMRSIHELAPPSSPRSVILVGSGEVYGRSGTTQSPLREDDPVRPLSPYGAAKACQEMVGWAYRRDDVRVVFPRSFPHTGPGQRPPFVIPDWILQLLQVREGKRDPVLEVGNLEITRDFTDVRDVARAYVDLLEDAEASGIFNVCSGEGRSLRQILSVLLERTGVQVEVREESARLRPTDIPSLVGTAQRLTDAVGWCPEVPFTATIDDLISDLSGSSLP